MAWNLFKAEVAALFANSGVAIFKAAVVIVAGSLLIKLVLKLLAKILSKGKVEKSARRFIYTSVKYILYFLLIMIIASIFKISITGFIAVFSALGLAISLALQSSLSNLANGIVILVSKPFKENDSVVIGDFEGIVKEVRLTHTILTGSDNKQISIPNKVVVDSVLVNGSANELKKINYSFLVSYSSDVEQVKSIILKSFSKTNYVLQDQKPFVAVDALKENGVLFKATCMVEGKYYVNAYHSILEDIFNEFKKEKIVLPYAQIEVRLKQEKETLPFYQNSKLKNKPVEKVIKPEKTYEHLQAQEETKTEEVKEELKNDEGKKYLDYVIEEEIEIDDNVKETEKNEDVKTENEEDGEKKKESFTSKLFKKFSSREKKPTIIIKKK